LGVVKKGRDECRYGILCVEKLIGTARSAFESLDADAVTSRWRITKQAKCDRNLADNIQQLFAPRLTGEIEHIGSTAIPGLDAKPILDLQTPVQALDPPTLSQRCPTRTAGHSPLRNWASGNASGSSSRSSTKRFTRLIQHSPAVFGKIPLRVVACARRIDRRFDDGGDRSVRMRVAAIERSVGPGGPRRQVRHGRPVTG
jgi:hypothetical protein